MKKLFLNKLAKKYSLHLILLFGSRANNTHRNDSDYDIAIKSNKQLGMDDYFNLIDDLEMELCEKIDLIDLKKQDDPLLNNNIAQNSTLLFEKEKGMYDDFQINAIYNYIDYFPLYKIEEEIVTQKLSTL